MEDFQIVDLYWERNEKAIRETDIKYGRLLGSVSYSLLSSREDSEECVNDTYFAAWNNMPSDRPIYLGAYLTRIVRNISISRFRKQNSEKRGGALELIDELAECIPASEGVEAEYENKRLVEALNRFLRSLDEEKRAVFVRRYYYSRSIDQISRELNINTPKLKTMLFRLRASLKAMLEEEELM